ncbi:MAG: hypothetical protein MI802_02570, partial [Desulfobacterales bacterium]|nr:hypothetical protein [Desulfobacterales bacterium]
MAKDSHPNKCRPEAWQQLQLLVEQLDDNPNALLRACFAICRHDLVDADFAVVDAQIDQWTGRILETVHSREPRALMAHTHALLFDELGFCGGR